MAFSRDFLWGAATASYQIEGTPSRTGGGRSVWDMFCRRPGIIHNDENGDVACDHYRLWREDIALMTEMGLQAYRFSISWPRVLPEGTGRVHDDGLAFYDRLVDGLLAAGIAPYVTLFHWDFPFDLYCRGGWLNRDSADWFADYTRVLVDKLSDRVTNWMTLNEPQCFIGLGHQSGVHAPGEKLATAEVLRAAHHALMAHGKAVQTIRAYSKQPAQIGYAPVGVSSMPATDSPADVEAARQATFDESTTSSWSNCWWIDPVFLGHYPEGSLRAYGPDAPPVQMGDLETICQPLDFFGCNIYNGQTVQAKADGTPELAPNPVGIGRTMYGWPVTPPCLYWGPKFFWERYHKPIVVTENGLAGMDWVALDGKVHDPQRIDFLERYLREFGRAIQEGVEARAYFQWSLMDNFEWTEGYKHRFGLVYVDYATQQRIPKESAFWYRDVIRSHGERLMEPLG